jgi:hypothetical protein
MKPDDDLLDRFLIALAVLPESERQYILLSLSTEQAVVLVELLAADCAERVRMQARLPPDLARRFVKFMRK